MHDRDEILRNYFLHLSNPSDPQLYALVEDVDDLVHTEPLKAWGLIRALIDISPSDDALGYLAAGPLENLLVLNGNLVAGIIRQEALHHQRVRDALGRVFLHPITGEVQIALGEWLPAVV